MASQHIEIDGTASRSNAELRGFIDALQRICDQSTELKATYDQATTDGYYSGLVILLGLSGDTSLSDATAIYNMIGDVNDRLHISAITQFLARLG